VRWRWQAVGGVGASASRRRVDGNNGSKGLGEAPCGRQSEAERGCVRALRRAAGGSSPRGSVLRGFEAKTTGDLASVPRRGVTCKTGGSGVAGAVGWRVPLVRWGWVRRCGKRSRRRRRSLPRAGASFYLDSPVPEIATATDGRDARRERDLALLLPLEWSGSTFFLLFHESSLYRGSFEL